MALPRYLSVYNVAELLGKRPDDPCCYDIMVAAGAINIGGMIRVADGDLYSHVGSITKAPVINLENDPDADDTVVYFVRVHDFIKIGVASNYYSRLQSLQVGCPYDVVFMGARAGGATTESNLHHHFAEDRWRGEWFKVSAPLLAFIHAHTAKVPGLGLPGRRKATLPPDGL